MKKYAQPIENALDYIKAQPPEYRKQLNTLRKIVKSSFSKAEETISYQVICYKYHYMLVGIGTKKNYVSFYTMNPELVKQLKSKLNAVKHAGSTLHFPLDKPLPVELIQEIIKRRVEENELRFQLRKNKK